MKWVKREKIDKKANPDELLLKYGGDIINDDRYHVLAGLKQHRTSNTMAHCIGVARACVIYAQRRQIPVDIQSLIRGALLHDYYLYEYTTDRRKGHFHHHGEWAMQNAVRDFGLNDLEKGMICTHMWPIGFFNHPESREAFILTLMDKRVAFGEVLHSRQKKKEKPDSKK